MPNIYGATSNNGNIQQQIIGLPGGIQISEAYSYDGANRLLVASEQSSNPGNPSCPDNSARYVEGFQYDVWGNRTVPCLVGLGPSVLTPGSFDTSTNRISSAGWVYDSKGLGNIVQEPAVSGYRMYLYDSENRVVAFCTQDAGGCVNADGTGRTRYLYDGDGRRVEKLDSTGVTVYVYDIQGNLAAEYSTETAAAGSGTEYLTADQLGTTRVVTAGTPGAATVVARRDYRPFGEEIVPGGSDPRVGVAGYLTGGLPTDMGTTVEFTGKERDAETGLDYFGARYFSSAQGRFTSPDDPFNDQDPADPQSWNMFAYGRNNPLRFIDPSGTTTCDENGNNCHDDITVDGGSSDGVPYIWSLLRSFGSQAAQTAVGITNTALTALSDFRHDPTCAATLAAAGTAAGAAVGTYAGATGAGAIGAAAGSIVPVFGTAAGGVLGGTAGGAAGGFIGGTGGYIGGRLAGALICSSGTGQGGGAGRTDHGQQRADEARAGDTHREVGGGNRVNRDGRHFTDSDSGHTVNVLGDRVVVTDSSEDIVTQFKNTRANTLQRIQEVRWVPKP